jgi:hypothetical protein
LTKTKEPRPIFTAEAGHYLSILIIILFAVSTLTLAIKLFTESRWVDIVSNAITLAIIGLVLRQPFDNLFAINIPDGLLSWLKPTILIVLLIIAVATAYNLIRDIVRVSRHHLQK